MIIVEGPDGAGKTTLIKSLVELTGLDVAPRVVSKEAKAMTDLVVWVEENLKSGWQPTIFDRHRLISEPIYGPIFRDKPAAGFNDPLWFIERLMSFYEIDPVVIYCLPPLETVAINILSDPDNSIYHHDPSLVHKVWGAYYNKIATDRALNTNSYVYDYTAVYAGSEMVRFLARTVTNEVEKHRV